uniref:Cystatin A n=1 Tax=Pelodiscus sinensis TaxID=13735 RepID=K7GFR9_PELSI|nr:cystatin-A [Pelodiscus sinensis]|eukprot:XP_006124242.1 cystatin-A [Pelodiscus sinensis]
MMTGGLSESKPATPEIQKIADQVKSQLEQKENKRYAIFEAIEYKSQVVAGTNYFIKVSVSDSTEECVHLRVFKSLPHEKKEPSLTAYQTGKTKCDELTYFE